MTHHEIVHTLTRWIGELRVKNASLQREIEWQRVTNSRLAAAKRRLEIVNDLQANPLSRYWVGRITPDQARELAAPLERA